MTPDKLPEEITSKIKADATAAYSDIPGFIAYTKGATAWAPWKVKCDAMEAAYLALQMEQMLLKQQAQRMVDALEEIIRNGENVRSTYKVGKPAFYIKVAKEALQQFKDGKGKEVVNA